MALTRFAFFLEPRRIHPDPAVFWFMIQIAIIVGWATSYPANIWLLGKVEGEDAAVPVRAGHECAQVAEGSLTESSICWRETARIRQDRQQCIGEERCNRSEMVILQ